jgi:hypothetical protein
MFKVAYARGVTKALLDTEAIKVASEELAEALADAGAETLPEEPVGEVPPETTAELAATLVELSNSLQESADNAAQAAETAAGGAPAAEETAAAPSEESVAKAAAFLRRKLSEDLGSTITGDRPEQQNTPANATNAEAKLDEMNRPGGEYYANVGEDGVGTQEASGQGAVGDEAAHPGSMGPAVGGANSATEAVKSAAIRAYIKKIAMGSTIDGSAQTPNAQTGEGVMENAARPAGYAVSGVGNSSVAAAERASAVGSEGAHPEQEQHEGGTNSAIQQISGGKVASEDVEYMSRFRQVGHKYASALPFYLSDMQKVATIQYLMGISPSERNAVVSYINKTAELPEGLKNYLATKENGDEEPKKEEKKEEEKKEEEKKEEEKKEASFNPLQRLRRMTR